VRCSGRPFVSSDLEQESLKRVSTLIARNHDSAIESKAKSFGDPHGCEIVSSGERAHLLQLKDVERLTQRLPSSLGCAAAPPHGRVEAPSDLYGGKDLGQERRD
jgi:hypothetical protein